MSTTAPVPSTTPTPTATAQPPEHEEIKVISHSNLFYWWPVWFVGFLMALLTWIDGSLLATVPPNSRTVPKVLVPTEGDPTKTTEREGIVAPEGKHLDRVEKKKLESAQVQPKVHMSRSKSYGVIFCLTLLICIVITNVPLRGMWSVVVIITAVMLALLFWAWDLWETIFTYVRILDIRINMGGYLFIAIALFAIWLITLLVFDRQIYIVFTPGQFKVCTEIGGGEKVFDVRGMHMERQKGDLFRHKILGLGSGDLTVITAGAQGTRFDLPNVLFIRQKVQRIERMLQVHQGGGKT